jgi:type VI secretion system protein ImpA
MADLEQLLAPVSADQPCGPDRADDRLAIEQPFERPESVDAAGGEAKAETDWAAVIDNIIGEFGRTKDLWLAIYLCRAGVYSAQLAWIELGANALAGMVERYWDAVHPSLAEYGVTARVMACNTLANRAAFVNPLLRMPILAHRRLGVFSGADFERLAKGREAESDFPLFQKLLTEVGPAQLQGAYDAIGGIEAALRQTETLFLEKSGGSESPDFALTYETLDKIRKAIAQFHAVPGEPSGDGAAEDGESGVGATGSLSGGVHSRADVVRAIDAIADYYRQHEPSSPVPVLLERARAWVNLPFMDVIADILPNSVDDARKLLMRRASEE